MLIRTPADLGAVIRERRKQLEAVWALRRVLSGLASDGGGNAAGLEMLIDRMKTFRTNDEFLAEVAKSSGS